VIRDLQAKENYMTRIDLSSAPNIPMIPTFLLGRPGFSNNRKLLECGRSDAAYQQTRTPFCITNPQIFPEEGNGQISSRTVQQW